MTGLQSAILGGSALILLVLALRLGAKNHRPRRLFPALWCAAAVRLLLPVSIPTRLSIWNLFKTASQPAAAASSPQTLLPFPDLAQGISSGALPAAEPGMHPVLIVWLAGSALLAAYVMIGYVFLVRRLQPTYPAPKASVDALLPLFRFRKAPAIRVTKSRRAPLTFGVSRPVILLPEDLDRGSEAFRLILSHELAHVRRHDCLRKLLFAVCLCLYWWNPLVWCMVILAGRDMELACDEAVLHVLGSNCRKAYALTLLSMAERNSRPAPLAACFSESSLFSRVRAIAGFRPVSKLAGLCAAIVFALSACVRSTQAARPASAGQAASVPEMVQAEAIKGSPALPEAIEPAAPDEAAITEDMPEETALKYVWPLEDPDAAVTDAYGVRAHPLSKTQVLHEGVDLDAPSGSSVFAVADGTVSECGYDEAYGYTVVLDHEDGVQTRYAHLSEYLVALGDSVRQGQTIGRSGSSGWSTSPHLHLGVFKDGASVDPLEFLKAANP